MESLRIQFLFECHVSVELKSLQAMSTLANKEPIISAKKWSMLSQPSSICTNIWHFFIKDIVHRVHFLFVIFCAHVKAA